MQLVEPLPLEEPVLGEAAGAEVATYAFGDALATTVVEPLLPVSLLLPAFSTHSRAGERGLFMPVFASGTGGEAVEPRRATKGQQPAPQSQT